MSFQLLACVVVSLLILIQFCHGDHHLVVRSDDPLESRADFIGWVRRVDGAFEPSYCYEGTTATTVDGIQDCCPEDGSPCRFETTCSSGYVKWTILQTPAISGAMDMWKCDTDDPASDCSRGVIYKDFTNTLTSPVFDFGCRDKGLASPVTYYRSLTEGATTIPFTPSYSPGTSRAATSEPDSPTGAPATLQPSRDPTHPGGPSQSSKTTDNSASSAGSPTNESEGQVSTSDKIAIGVGIGIGLPTVLIGLLAWLYPRHHRRDPAAPSRGRRPSASVLPQAPRRPPSSIELPGSVVSNSAAVQNATDQTYSPSSSSPTGADGSAVIGDAITDLEREPIPPPA